MIVTQHPTAAGQDVFVERAGLLIFAQLAQIGRVNRPGFGGGSLVESQATRLVRSPSSYRASNSVGGLYPQAP